MVRKIAEILGKYFVHTIRLLVIVLVLVFGLMFVQVYMHAPKAEELIGYYPESIWEPEIGSYSGEYHGLIGLSKVSFEISDSGIEWFRIEQAGTTPFFSVKKEDFERHIMEQQKLDFDAVSGATYTSNFIKAAIIDAASRQ